jgi:hypothetical protein
VEFLASDSAQGRGIGTKRLDMVRNYIVKNFRNAGLKPLNYDFVIPFSGYSYPIRFDGYNIAGMMEGSDDSLKNEIIVLGAHYDHLGTNYGAVFYGANDNASGVALLMELAFELKKMKNQIKRSILFVAFDAEEVYLNGSSEFINSDTNLRKRIQTMFSLDMVGTYRESKKLMLTGFDLLKTDPEYCKDIATINDIVIKTNKEIERRTDSYSFLMQGIPAVHVTTGDDKYYHSSKDTPEKLDYEGMAKILNFSADLILKLNSENANIFEKITDISLFSNVKKFQYGYTLGMGSSFFDYTRKYYQGKNEFAMTAGMNAEVRLFSDFKLSTGLIYSLSGSKHQYGTYRAHSLEIPANIIYTIPFRLVISKPSLIVGGYYSKHLYQTVTRENVEPDDVFRKFDAGINVGFGIRLMNLHVKFMWKNGLINQHLDIMNEKVWLKGSQVVFTYFR